MPDAVADEIASLVLEQFDRLPQKRKPAVRDNGIHEWVPLSAIVVEGTYIYARNLDTS
jgi:tRNA-specific adenosine deaminase 1